MLVYHKQSKATNLTTCITIAFGHASKRSDEFRGNGSNNINLYFDYIERSHIFSSLGFYTPALSRDRDNWLAYDWNSVEWASIQPTNHYQFLLQNHTFQTLWRYKPSVLMFFLSLYRSGDTNLQCWCFSYPCTDRKIQTFSVDVFPILVQIRSKPSVLMFLLSLYRSGDTNLQYWCFS